MDNQGGVDELLAEFDGIVRGFHEAAADEPRHQGRAGKAVWDPFALHGVRDHQLAIFLHLVLDLEQFNVFFPLDPLFLYMLRELERWRRKREEKEIQTIILGR